MAVVPGQHAFKFYASKYNRDIMCSKLKRTFKKMGIVAASPIECMEKRLKSLSTYFERDHIKILIIYLKVHWTIL